jgi:hypothetical protein
VLDEYCCTIYCDTVYSGAGQGACPFNSYANVQAILQKLTKQDILVKQVNMKILPNSSKEIDTQLAPW